MRQEQQQISREQIIKAMDLDEIVKERDERITKIEKDSIKINSLATEINHQMYTCDNILDQVTKNTEDANRNMLKANKELTIANTRAMNRRNFCLRFVITMTMLMLFMGLVFTKGYYLF